MTGTFFMKATIAFLLILSILPSLFSCSGAERDSDESELSLSSLEIIPSNNYSGMEDTIYPEKFTVLCEAGTQGELFASSEDEGFLQKSIFIRNAALSSDYGITPDYVIEQDIVKKVTAEMLSEDKSYDILLFSAQSAPALISCGAIEDLNSFAGWSEELRGYSHKVIDDLSIGEKTFLAVGDATPSLFASTSSVLMNSELAAKIDAESSIISAAKNGHFTYDMMLNYSKKLSQHLGNETFSASSVIRLKSSDAYDLYVSGGGIFFETDPITDIPFGISFDEKETDIYKSVMSLFSISENDDTQYEAQASAPLFITASINELASLALENSPFVALPMPKSNVIQSEYLCNVDMKSVRFTALPRGSGENELAIMNLIYKLSDDVISSMYGTVDKNSNGTAKLVYENARASVLTLFGFGDIEDFMASCVTERINSKSFAIRAEERSLAASAALSIIIEKSIKANQT